MRSRSSLFLSTFTSILCLSEGFSLCLALTATQAQPKARPVADLTSTTEDERLEAWYKQQGILGTDVKVRTTTHSVAGRGLFYSSERPAEKGDLLSFIPSRCVLTRETAKRQLPDIQPENSQYSREWPVILTACAHRALHEDKAWSEWIQTWQGPSAPSPPSLLSNDEIQSLAMQTQSSPNEIKRALQVRYDVFQGHCARLEELYGCRNVGDLYTVVLSRSATLGPDWNYESGIIPLHDMLNHPPPNKIPSVELFSVGEIASHTARNHVANLAKSTFALTNLEDRDLVLVARQTIHSGEELFLSYTNNDLLTSEQSRVWMTLQYGFCLG